MTPRVLHAQPSGIFGFFPPLPAACLGVFLPMCFLCFSLVSPVLACLCLDQILWEYMLANC
jgi:hypothetical protein